MHPPKYLSVTNYLTYCLIIWGNACKTFLDQILVLQKRPLHLISFAETNDHAIPFFVNAKVLTLQALYCESVCSLKCDVNKNTAPDNILKLFSRISSVHTYNTRASTSEHFYTKESRLNVQRNAFSRFGVKIWDGIPQIFKERPKKAFKRSLKAMLLDILQTDDSYIDVDTVIVKMKKSSSCPLLSFHFIFTISLQYCPCI